MKKFMNISPLDIKFIFNVQMIIGFLIRTIQKVIKAPI